MQRRPRNRGRPATGRGEPAGGGGAGAGRHDVHHQVEPAGGDIVHPVPPFLCGRGTRTRSSPAGPTHTMAGRTSSERACASDRTANRVAVASAGATAVRKSVSRSVKSAPDRTIPAAPQQARRPGTSAGAPGPAPTVARRSAAGCCAGGRLADRSESLRHRRTAPGQRGEAVRLAVREYSASASSGLVLGRDPVVPLVMVLITRVSGSIVAQQVRSVPHLPVDQPIAAACSSPTPSPDAARPAMSRRARWARSSHIRSVWPPPSASDSQNSGIDLPVTTALASSV